MTRHIVRFNCPYVPQQLFDIFMDYWQKEGFAPHVENNEQCMKKGSGVVAAPQFVKITFLNGVYTIEAWIKFAVVPGVYAGEMDLNGFMGAVPKKKLLQRIYFFLNLVNAQILP